MKIEANQNTTGGNCAECGCQTFGMIRFKDNEVHLCGYCMTKLEKVLHSYLHEMTTSRFTEEDK